MSQFKNSLCGGYLFYQSTKVQYTTSQYISFDSRCLRIHTCSLGVLELRAILIEGKILFHCNILPITCFWYLSEFTGGEGEKEGKKRQKESINFMSIDLAAAVDIFFVLS